MLSTRLFVKQILELRVQCLQLLEKTENYNIIGEKFYAFGIFMRIVIIILRNLNWLSNL